MLTKLKFKIWTRLIRIHWWCVEALDLLDHHKQHKPIFFIPLAPWAISLIIAGISFGAQLAISAFLTPKSKQQVRGKLTGEITLTDSIFGAPISRIYGGRPADNSAGGVEAGCNIFWMSDIRKIETQSPGGDGGGGKGSPDPPPNITINYKVDLAGVVGAGRLRLLRMKWNEDTVYSLIGGSGGGGGVPTDTYEAELQTLGGGATAVADAACSGGQKVTGIGLGGTLSFTIDYAPTISAIPEPGDPPTPYFSFAIRYKAVGDLFAYVQIDGDGGQYMFPDTGGAVGTKNILINGSSVTASFGLEFNNPAAAAPEIDKLDFSLRMITEAGPTGIRNADFPPEAPQDNILLPNPYLTDTQAFERYDLISPVIVSSAFEVPVLNGASLAWYEGSDDQLVDPVIDAQVTSVYGSGSTPAFRDSAYFRIQNMDITDYGAVPAIRVIVENVDLQTVSEILLFEGTQIGLETADFDLSTAAALHVRGYFMGDSDAPSKAFEDLGLLHNLTFTENHDGKIVAVDLNNRTVVATLTENDLGAYIAEESDEVPLDDVVSTVPEESEDLIRLMELSFNNPQLPSDYSTDRRAYNFPFTDSQRKETRSVNITMLGEEAAAVVRREMQKHHLKQTPDTIVTTHKYAWVNAGECIEVPIDGELQRRRVEDKNGSAPGVYEMTLVNEEVFVLADDGDIISELVDQQAQKPTKQATKFPANSVGTIMDTPALTDNQRGKTGVYVGACSRGNGAWKGCQVFREKGGVYSPLVALTKQASMGVSLDDDPKVASVSGFLDPDAVITVDFYGDFNPTTVTTPQAEDGANSYCIGEEVAIIKDWTRDTAFPNRWVGTSVYRGLKDTLDKTGIHTGGERVVLLDDAVKFVPLDVDEIDTVRTWKFVTYGADINDSAIISFTYQPGMAIIAGENLVAGNMVTIYDGGSLSPRAGKADATDDTKPCHGFILQDALAGEKVRVYFGGERVTGLVGLAPGQRLYLSETAGAITGTAPSGSGKIVQFLGTALSETSMIFEPEDPIKLA